METSLFSLSRKHYLSENKSSQPDLVKQKPCLAQESPGSFLLVRPSQPHDACSEARGSPAYSAVLLLHSEQGLAFPLSGKLSRLQLPQFLCPCFAVGKGLVFLLSGGPISSANLPSGLCTHSAKVAKKEGHPRWNAVVGI